MTMVAVVIPTYKSNDTIDRAIDSVLSQTYPPSEIIVVDDASGDDTMQRLRGKYGEDPRFSFLLREVNGGPSSARNTGIESTQAEWIALLDADDAWVPDRLKVLFNAAGDADFIVDNLTTYDATAQKTTGAFFEPFQSDAVTLEDCLLGWVGDGYIDIGIMKPLMKRSFLQKHALSYDPSLYHGEDYLLHCSALIHGAKFRAVNFYGYVYTTPVGLESGRLSPHSRTVSDGSKMASKLLELRDNHAQRLSISETRAFNYCLETLLNITPWWEFVTAVRLRQLATSIRLFIACRYVRQRAYEVLRRKIFGVKRSRPR